MDHKAPLAQRDKTVRRVRLEEMASPVPPAHLEKTATQDEEFPV